MERTILASPLLKRNTTLPTCSGSTRTFGRRRSSTETVGSEIEVLFDGGIHSGQHVMRAWVALQRSHGVVESGLDRLKSISHQDRWRSRSDQQSPRDARSGTDDWPRPRSSWPSSERP